MGMELKISKAAWGCLALALTLWGVLGVGPLHAYSTLTTTPNPCVIQNGFCATTVAWQTTDAAQTLVMISDNGGSEVVFACAGNQGSQSIGLIQAQHAYEFRLYSSASCTAPTGPLLAAVTVSALPTAHPAPAPSVGLNKLELLTQYLGRASGGDGSPAYQRVERAQARKAIRDARRWGVSYLRVALPGFYPVLNGAPGDLDLWRSDPAAYWAIVDQMMNDLGGAGMRMVASVGWNYNQIPAMTNESFRTMVTQPNSTSYQLYALYITEFVTRYRNHPAIYLYEMPNEINLGVDLDVVGRCRSEVPPAWDPTNSRCNALGNLSTNEMIAFNSRLAALIRGLDPSHPIASGYAIPRTSAEHLRRQPEWSPGGADFTLDSAAEFQRNLVEIHQGLDVVTVHFYNMDQDNERFGNTGHFNANVIDLMKQASDSAGKPLYIGEFADIGPAIYDPGTQTEVSGPTFTRNVLNKIQSLAIPYSSIWALEFYSNLYTTYDILPTSSNLEPGYTPLHLDALAQTNAALGVNVPPPPAPDVTAPDVILTWPLENATIASSQRLYAVASDDLSVSRVEFWVDDVLTATVTNPPYQTTINGSSLQTGFHRIEARAFDAAGNRGTFLTTFGPTPNACDVDGNGTPDVLDVQSMVTMAIGITACTADVNHDAACNVIDVQRVVNAALGGLCISN